MRKITIVLLGLMFAGSNAFTQAIPNFSFESSYTENQTPHSFVVPVSWSTSDMIASDFNGSYAGSAVTISPVSYLGNFAVLMQTSANNGDTVAGAIYSVDSIGKLINDALGANIGLGFPINNKPATLNGYYKFNGVGNDSIEYIIIMTAWDNVHHGRDTIVNMTGIGGANVGSYTLFSININYLINNIVPDTALIATGFVAPNGGTVHLGTAYYLDDLFFSGTVPLDVTQVVQKDTHANLRPNPFTDRAILALDNTITLQNATLEITNELGQTIRTIANINANTIPIERSDLQSGMYFYRLINNKQVVNTGKFIVE